ncbi:hypothetical protein D3C79_845360 [compost metagenome]
MLGFSMLFGLLGAVMLIGVPMVLLMRNPRQHKPSLAKESATCSDNAHESA